MKGPRIKPQVLKGFRDYPPEQMAARLAMMRTASEVFESFGFLPLETPVIEYSEVLLGKYGEEGEKQFYRFPDHGGRDVCLRFDLTVPLARYVAMNRDLPRPFKRYQMGTVFRGEHPKKGRFREFVQCDVDIVGTRSLTADAECIAVGTTLLTRVGVPEHVIRVNHRGILNALFHTVGIDDMGQVTRTFRTLDKLEKVGEDEVRRALADEVGLSATATDRVFGLLSIRGPHADVLAKLREFFENEAENLGGVTALEELLSHLRAFGVPPERVEVDLGIARGIDYYTGVVYETALSGRPEFGSIMSGGRYDHLIELMAGEEIPAVGISMGLDRLVAALVESGAILGTGNPTRVLVVAFGSAGFPAAQAIAGRVRAAGINAEVSHEIQKVGAQFKYADRKGIPYVLTEGDDERARGVVKLKDLKAQSERETTLPEAIAALQS
ncbi:MAG: histidine--tRNA ligase [Acidobacteriota bacterium]